MLNMVYLFSPFKDHFIRILVTFLSLKRSFIDVLATLLIGFSRIVQIKHFEDILVCSRENFLIGSHFESLVNEMLGSGKLLKGRIFPIGNSLRLSEIKLRNLISKFETVIADLLCEVVVMGSDISCSHVEVDLHK